MTLKDARISQNALNSDDTGLESRRNTDETRSSTPPSLSELTDIPKHDSPTTANIADNALKEGVNLKYLTDYMLFESNTSPNLPLISFNLSGRQDHASSAINGSVDNRNRRAPRTRGSLGRMNTEETDVFWNESNDSENSQGCGCRSQAGRIRKAAHLLIYEGPDIINYRLL